MSRYNSASYKLVDGTTIANNWTGLVSGTLLNGGISKDQTGIAVTASTHVWTNVASNGTAYSSGSNVGTNCSGWTTNASGGTKKAYYGLTSSTTSTWTASTLEDACSASPADHIYCFEQAH